MPTRRRLFELLAAKPMPVGALAEYQPISRPAVSQHLKVLTEAGLVQAHPEGTRRVYAGWPQGLFELCAWLDRYWDGVLAAFEQEGVDQKGKHH